MKILLRAAIAAASIASIGPANAESEGGPHTNSRFTEIPGVLAEAPAQFVPAVATAQKGFPAQVYAAQASRSTWLFVPHDGGGAKA